MEKAVVLVKTVEGDHGEEFTCTRCGHAVTCCRWCHVIDDDRDGLCCGGDCSNELPPPPLQETTVIDLTGLSEKLPALAETFIGALFGSERIEAERVRIAAFELPPERIEAHCWDSRSVDDDHQEVCMLRPGHNEPHDYTLDTDIAVSFVKDD